MNNTTIIYLHGFLSGPKSPRAIQTAEYFQTHLKNTRLLLPQLTGDLHNIIAMITGLVQQHRPCHFIGNSFGGFLANWAVEHFGGKAVLINPVVYCEKIKAQFIGIYENPHTHEQVKVDEEVFNMLQALEPAHITADRYWVLLQKGDEVLDYQLAEHRYRSCRLTVEEGGDHSFINYASWLPQIVQFLT